VGRGSRAWMLDQHDRLWLVWTPSRLHARRAGQRGNQADRARRHDHTCRGASRAPPRRLPFQRVGICPHGWSSTPKAYRDMPAWLVEHAGGISGYARMAGRARRRHIGICPHGWSSTPEAYRDMPAWLVEHAGGISGYACMAGRARRRHIGICLHGWSGTPGASSEHARRSVAGVGKAATAGVALAELVVVGARRVRRGRLCCRDRPGGVVACLVTGATIPGVYGPSGGKTACEICCWRTCSSV